MAHRFIMRRRVQFAETDAAGIMHFSNFFRWFEETEHAFYRSLDLTIHPLEHGAVAVEAGWPRLKASAEFRLPLGFGEEAEVELLVAEVRTRAIRFAFRLWKNPDPPETRALAGTGELVVVAVRHEGDGRKMSSVSIPAAFRSRMEAAPPEALALPASTNS